MYSRALLEGPPAFSALQASMSKLAHKVMQKEASRWRKMLRAGKLSPKSKLRLIGTNKATTAVNPIGIRLEKYKKLKETGTAPREAARAASKPAQQPFSPILDFNREARGIAKGNKRLMQLHGIRPIRNPLPNNPVFKWHKPSSAQARVDSRTVSLGHGSATPGRTRRHIVTGIDRQHNMQRYGNPFGKAHRFPVTRFDPLARFYRNPKTGMNWNTVWEASGVPGLAGRRLDFRTPIQRSAQTGAQYLNDVFNRWAMVGHRASLPVRHAWADLKGAIHRARNKNAPAPARESVVLREGMDRFPQSAYVDGKLMPKPARAGDVAGTARHEIDEVIRGLATGRNKPNYFSHVDPTVLQREAGHLNFMHPAAREKALRMRARTGELQHFADTVAGRPSTGVRPNRSAVDNMSVQELEELAQPFLQSHKLSPAARKRLTQKLQENFDEYWRPRIDPSGHWYGTAK